MICPVCRTESYGKSKCSHCGFDQLNKEFISKEDYNYWVETVVNTCQNVYLTTKANALKNASYRDLRNEINLRPPIVGTLSISRPIQSPSVTRNVLITPRKIGRYSRMFTSRSLTERPLKWYKSL